MIKKTIILITTLLTILLLFGCETPIEPIDKAFNELEIGLQGTDTLDSITQDITLPTTIDGLSNLEITWSSENEDLISLTGSIQRQATDVTLVLTAFIKLGDEEKFKFFTVTLKQLDDSEPPVIMGTKDIYLDLGTTNPDYLNGVYALDNIDPNVEVTVDASDVNLDVLGTYEITYHATDSSGLTTSVTVTVTVVDEPLITISDIASVAANTPVKIRGSITASYTTNTSVIFYIEDATGGIQVEAPLAYAYFIESGHEVLLRASKQVIGSTISLNALRDITYLDDLARLPKSALADNLSNFSNQFVSVYGLVNEIHTFIHTTYTLESLQGPLTLQIPEHMNADTKYAIQAKLRNLDLGLGITIEGVVDTQGSNHVVLLTNPDMIHAEANLDHQEILNVIKQNVDIPEFSGVISQNLTLLRNQDLLFGVKVIYTSSNETVLSSNGQVSPLEDNTPVTLEYVLLYGDIVLEAKTFDLVVQGTSQVYTGYYESLTGKSGGGLVIELRNIISVYTYRSYDEARYILQESDEDPNNPNNIILVYNRASVNSTWDSGITWNREHIWPQSYLSTTHETSDLHNLKPADQAINSNRSNLSFRDSVESSYGKVNGGWFPGDEDKGDVARILFYMVTRYTHLGLDIMGLAHELLKWHEEDPVDDFERNRNDVIYSYQDNRNPFIDHPELVHQIWSA